MNTGKELVLEPSTNTHKLTDVLDSAEVSTSIVKARVGKNSKLLHGEHRVIGIESENIVKYNQQELNPVTKKFQKAFD